MRPRGRAVQVDPIKPKLKPPGTKRLKVQCDILLSTSAFHFNLRRYPVALHALLNDIAPKKALKVGRCSLTLSNPI